MGHLAVALSLRELCLGRVVVEFFQPNTYDESSGDDSERNTRAPRLLSQVLVSWVICIISTAIGLTLNVRKPHS
jgi:hypothetical protein